MVEDLAEYGKSMEREVSAVYWISPLHTSILEHPDTRERSSKAPIKASESEGRE